jgi:hypothetical protein
MSVASASRRRGNHISLTDQNRERSSQLSALQYDNYLHQTLDVIADLIEGSLECQMVHKEPLN